MICECRWRCSVGRTTRLGAGDHRRDSSDDLEHRPMPMLADIVDAVVGADTHRDTHELEIAHSTGAAIAAQSADNDTRGHADAVAWIAEHAPGPRVMVAIEGTRSYRAGLARALDRKSGVE